ncbi:MAG: UDP-N-acetylmuramoylalanyl-D-glutamyl-2,6-diaminopimelate--D-alanyl-D-alanine ligase [Pseudomonadota bacterium]
MSELDLSETGEAATPANIEPLWRGEAFLAGTKGRNARGGLPTAVTGISIDTRTLEQGDAFFAIAGDRFDGHNFITAAIRAGASVLVVAQSKLAALGMHQLPIIVVPDVLKALENLGRAARARSAAQIVAITGSAGKTTTKEALKSVLEKFGETHASPASFNNHWGVPLTLARMPKSSKFGVFEIGMNHPGEITPLVDMVQPHVSVVTTIAAAHLGQFESLDAIAEAKAEIFTGLVSGGTAVINGDIAQTQLLRTRAQEAKAGSILTFGQGSGNDTQLTDHTLTSGGSRFSALVSGGAVDANLRLPGRHQIQNMLALLTVVDLFGVDLPEAARALGGIAPGKGRGETHRIEVTGGKATLIDEAYNANPQAMEAMFEVMAATKVDGTKSGDGGRRILVLGDMKELGDKSASLHAALAAPIMNAGIDLVFTGGAEMQHLHEALPVDKRGAHAADAQSLAPLVKKALQPGDVIAIKASNSMKFASIVDALRGTPAKTVAGTKDS